MSSPLTDLAHNTLSPPLPFPPAAPPEPATLPGPEPDRDPEQLIESEMSFTMPPLDVHVIRSKRRKKTAEARLRGNVLEVRIPASSSSDEEQHFVDHFVARFEKQRRATTIDVQHRAEQLAAEYGLPFPDSVRWVTNQNHRWGSCTPADGSIRLSDRLAAFPSWVIDYVIVHELAHLVEFDHNDRFWNLVSAYPKAERARGYLIAKSEA